MPVLYTGRSSRSAPSIIRLLKFPVASLSYALIESGLLVVGNLSDVKLVFLALPEGESEAYLPKLGGKRIIDLSSDIFILLFNDK